MMKHPGQFTHFFYNRKQKSIMKRHLTQFLELIVALLLLLSLTSEAYTDDLCNTSKKTLKEKIECLAERDVHNEIPRRTKLILEIYKNNVESLTPSEILEIYDNKYSKLCERERFKRTIRWGIYFFLFLGILVYGYKKQYHKIIMNRKMKVKSVSVNPPWIGTITLEVDETMQKAAWSLYIELITRIATQKLEDEEGFNREALTSLYNLFTSTREILKDSGPDIGRAKESVGGIALAVLNKGLRTFLAKWHPELKQWEHGRDEKISEREHEKQWPQTKEFRKELRQLGEKLEEYANSLIEIVESRQKKT